MPTDAMLDFTPIALSKGARVANRFEVVGTLGRGPTAIVYQAIDHADRVEVALSPHDDTRGRIVAKCPPDRSRQGAPRQAKDI